MDAAVAVQQLWTQYRRHQQTMAHQLGGVGFAAIGGLATLLVIVCQPLALAQLNQQLVSIQLQALQVIDISKHSLISCNV